VCLGARAPAQETKFWADKKKFGTEAIYGSAFNIRKDLDCQILSRSFPAPPPLAIHPEIFYVTSISSFELRVRSSLTRALEKSIAILSGCWN
jgi:hypothetical protein